MVLEGATERQGGWVTMLRVQLGNETADTKLLSRGSRFDSMLKKRVIRLLE